MKTLILALVVFQAQAATPVQSVNSDPSCGECRLRIVPTTLLPDISDTGRILRLSSGTIVLSHQDDWDRLHIYEADGRLRRSLGRQGQGPGEYTNIVDLKLDEDQRVHVFDYEARWTLLDTTGVVIDTRPLPPAIFPNGVTLLTDGRLLINRRDSSPSRFGYWLFLVDTARASPVPFGERFTDINRSAALSAVAFRHTAARTTEIVVAHNHKYRLQVSDLVGKTLRTVDRTTAFFPSFLYEDWPQFAEEGSEMIVDGQIRPTIAGIKSDEGGNIYVAINVGQDGWEEALAEGRISDAFVSVIEVWDPGLTDVLYSESFSFYTRGFAESGELIEIREGPYRTDIQLWDVELVNPNGR